MKKLLLITIAFTLLLFYYNNKKNEVVIPNEAIRFRIIANSNSDIDQQTKILVRDDLQKQIVSDLENVKNIDMARNTLKTNTKSYETLIEKILNKNNIETDVDVNYGMNYFPEKTYKGVRYNEGSYESLVVTLGNGTGKNWWCVLFPPLCLLEAEEETKEEKVEYKFFVKELIDKFFK